MHTPELHPSLSAPLCVNCAHCRPHDDESGRSYDCARPEALRRSVVSGKPTYPYCIHQRAVTGACRPEGKHFQPLPTCAEPAPQLAADLG